MANDWSSSRAARMAKASVPSGQRDERAVDVVRVAARDGDQREQPDDVAEHLGDAVADQRAAEGGARAAGVPGVVGDQRRERDGDGDHRVGRGPVAGPGAMREPRQRVPDELHEQVAQDDEHGAGRIPAQHPDGAQRPDGQQRGGRPGDQDVAPLRQARAPPCGRPSRSSPARRHPSRGTAGCSARWAGRTAGRRTARAAAPWPARRSARRAARPARAPQCRARCRPRSRSARRPAKAPGYPRRRAAARRSPR